MNITVATLDKSTTPSPSSVVLRPPSGFEPQQLPGIHSIVNRTNNNVAFSSRASSPTFGPPPRLTTKNPSNAKNSGIVDMGPSSNSNSNNNNDPPEHALNPHAREWKPSRSSDTIDAGATVLSTPSNEPPEGALNPHATEWKPSRGVSKGHSLANSSTQWWTCKVHPQLEVQDTVNVVQVRDIDCAILVENLRLERDRHVDRDDVCHCYACTKRVVDGRVRVIFKNMAQALKTEIVVKEADVLLKGGDDHRLVRVCIQLASASMVQTVLSHKTLLKDQLPEMHAQSWRDYKSSSQTYSRVFPAVACEQCAVWVINIPLEIIGQQLVSLVNYLLEKHSSTVGPRLQHCQIGTRSLRQDGVVADQIGYLEFANPSGVQTLLNAYKRFRQQGECPVRSQALKSISPFVKSGVFRPHMMACSAELTILRCQLSGVFEGLSKKLLEDLAVKPDTARTIGSLGSKVENTIDVMRSEITSLKAQLETVLKELGDTRQELEASEERSQRQLETEQAVSRAKFESLKFDLQDAKYELEQTKRNLEASEQEAVLQVGAVRQAMAKKVETLEGELEKAELQLKKSKGVEEEVISLKGKLEDQDMLKKGKQYYKEHFYTLRSEMKQVRQEYEGKLQSQRVDIANGKSEVEVLESKAKTLRADSREERRSHDAAMAEKNSEIDLLKAQLKQAKGQTEARLNVLRSALGAEIESLKAGVAQGKEDMAQQLEIMAEDEVELYRQLNEESTKRSLAEAKAKELETQFHWAV